MLDNKTITYLQEKYDGHKIIYVRCFNNEEFLFRTLNKKEYKYIKSQASDIYELNDLICIVSCVYPNDYDFEHCYIPGVIDKVAPLIEEESGFTEINNILKYYYQEKENTILEQQCMDMIKAFIPEYTYEEMQEWTWQKLMTVTARAEKIAKLKGFDYSLNDRTKEMEEEYEKMNSNNKEFVDNLYKNGIDPMVHYKDELKFTKDIIDYPFIIGSNFNNEEVLNAVKEQIKAK